MQREGDKVLIAAGLSDLHRGPGSSALFFLILLQGGLAWYAWTIYADLRKHHLL